MASWKRKVETRKMEKRKRRTGRRKICMGRHLKYSPQNRCRPSQSGIQIDFLPIDQTTWCQRCHSPHEEAGITTGSSWGQQNAQQPVAKVSLHVGQGIPAEPRQGRYVPGCVANPHFHDLPVKQFIGTTYRGRGPQDDPWAR